MTLFNDYLTAGLRAVEKWRPQLAERFNRPESATHATGERPAMDGNVLDTGEGSPFASWPPTLAELTAAVGPLPPYSLTLGACEDGLPFLLDLANPAPGALLVCGDPGCGKNQLLLTVLTSGILQNQPEQLAISIIADEPERYLDLADAEHIQEIFPADDPAVGDLIQELSSLVEERRHSGPGELAVLLVIDDLAACLEALEPESFERLYRLARHGPRARVWTIAGLATRTAPTRTVEQFLAAFRTRLYGRIASPNRTSGLTSDLPHEIRSNEDGVFCLPYGEEWLRLWACAGEDAGENTLDDEFEDQPDDPGEERVE